MASDGSTAARCCASALPASLIAVNWGVYIWGVNNGHVIETSLGYFINPLVTIGLGVVILHERLRAVQWAAVGLGVVAVAVLSFDYGRPPWIALALACVVRRRMGSSRRASAHRRRRASSSRAR